MRAAKASGLPRRLVDCVRDDPFDGRGIDFRPEKETDALAKLLSRTIDDDRYPLSRAFRP
jgi:hypothetical protein